MHHVWIEVLCFFILLLSFHFHIGNIDFIGFSLVAAVIGWDRAPANVLLS